MKKFLLLGFEIFSYIAVGLVVGYYIDKAFALKGWGLISSVFICYLLWFLNFFKKLK
ncbi:MAG: AtpZ/AtpI family protein [Bdellovibrionales bacterium]